MPDSSAPTRRRLAVIALVAVGAAVPAVAAGAGDLADPSATTTTTSSSSSVPGALAASTTTSTTAVRDVVAVTTTTTTTTTTTSSSSTTSPTGGPPSVGPPSVGPATTAPGPAEAATTVATGVVASMPPGEPGGLVTSATVPTDPHEPVSIGGWSTDPDDWSPAVQAYLASQGVDLDAAGSAGDAQIGELLSNEGCAVNCITSGLAHAVGVGVYLEVTTSVPATVGIEVLGEGLRTTPSPGLIFGSTWAHLEPATTYDAVAWAVDAQGNVAVASGTFTTLTRSASVTFTPTVLWFGNDPSFDPFGDHTWQLQADAFLDGQLEASASGATASSENIQSTASALGLTIETGTIDDGAIDVTYVGRYVCIDGCGDGGGVFDLEQGVPLGVESANGSVSDHDSAVWWGTIANGIQLDGYPDDVTSWTGHEFTFPLSTFHGQPVGPAVYLAADVTVDVSYRPAT